MTLHVIVSGRVQGVGFRNYVKSKARKLGLAGWVTNLPDGRVEAEFVGDKHTLDKILRICRRGPFLARVSGVDVQWVHHDAPHTSFDVIK